MIIEIFTLDKFDKESLNVSMAFRKCGGNSDVKFTKLYRFPSSNPLSYYRSIAEEILVDRIVEGYRIFEKPSSRSFRSLVVVDVWFKDTVTDIVGESVKLAIRDGGFKEPDFVRTAKRFYFFKRDKRTVDFIMENYANELIHRVDVIGIRREGL